MSQVFQDLILQHARNGQRKKTSNNISPREPVHVQTVFQFRMQRRWNIASSQSGSSKLPNELQSNNTWPTARLNNLFCLEMYRTQRCRFKQERRILKLEEVFETADCITKSYQKPFQHRTLQSLITIKKGSLGNEAMTGRRDGTTDMD